MRTDGWTEGFEAFSKSITHFPDDQISTTTMVFLRGRLVVELTDVGTDLFDREACVATGLAILDAAGADLEGGLRSWFEEELAKAR